MSVESSTRTRTRAIGNLINPKYNQRKNWLINAEPKGSINKHGRMDGLDWMAGWLGNAQSHSRLRNLFAHAYVYALWPQLNRSQAMTAFWPFRVMTATGRNQVVGPH